MMGWCDGLRLALRTCLWQLPQMSASIGRDVVVKGAAARRAGLWMLWQLVHDTSFFECLPASQNARCLLPPWHIRHTASFSAATLLRPTTFSGFFAGSL